MSSDRRSGCGRCNNGWICKSIQINRWGTSTAAALVRPARIRRANSASSELDWCARSVDGRKTRSSPRLTASFYSVVCRVDTSGMPRARTLMSREQFTNSDARYRTSGGHRVEPPMPVLIERCWRVIGPNQRSAGLTRVHHEEGYCPAASGDVKRRYLLVFRRGPCLRLPARRRHPARLRASRFRRSGTKMVSLDITQGRGSSFATCPTATPGPGARPSFRSL